MRDRKEIESDMEQFISAHPGIDEIVFYHRLILEVFLDIREMINDIGFMIQDLTKGR